jgi:hypothetical protein
MERELRCFAFQFFIPYGQLKIAADFYHFMLQGRFWQIDEDIDGPKRIAMLRKESLDWNPMSAETVLEMADALPINQ